MARFNEEFYPETNPEALASDKTAFEHFVTEGWESGAQANAEGEVLSGDDIVTEATLHLSLQESSDSIDDTTINGTDREYRPHFFGVIHVC
jgi:hypothetical protein